jgi:hypothetical protein
MALRPVTKRIFLSSNSADRFPFGETRTDTVVFEFAQPIVCRSNEHIHMTLESFSCPNALYNVSEGKNVLTTSAGSVTIPVGQYNTPSSLVVALQSVLTTASITITVAYNELLNKLTFQNTSASAITILPSSVWYRLGLMKSTNFVVGASSTVTLPRMVDLSGGRAIQFSITNHSFDSRDSHGNSTTSSSVLASIPLTVPFGGLQTYAETNGTITRSFTKNVSELDVSLLTLDNEPFLLEGLKWSATLLVTIF